ncbi:MAG: hypothetical protein QOH97_2261, partial [Actinoplanes sp.]|nr:hypothetical protein [Actinoplanes sp.]
IASSAAVMSGPFTEDVRGDLWQPLTRKSDDAASKRRPAGESDDCEPDRRRCGPRSSQNLL